MARFILRRIGLALITLWLLSVLVFFLVQFLPGNVARSILGPLAAQETVDRLNHQLGTDKPFIEQYFDWLKGILHGDLGDSLTYRSPVRPFITSAFENSLKLAALAFVIVVPVSLIGGIIAALKHGKVTDRVITTGGLSLAAVPEFVTSVVMITVFGIWLNVLPISAATKPGASIGDQIYHLLMPALVLCLVLFGYIARMARAGMIEALDSDYTRTARLKGLSNRTVIVRHDMRNALLPTITVIATQLGYLIGGLVVVEIIFNYRGIGSLIFNAAISHDTPMLEAGVLVVGVVYLVATLIADILYALLNPRIRHAGVDQ
jgi:peptide/nickel transport system permease protein